jgi:hypothetical protein
MTNDSCILFYRVRYCISYRTENKLFYFIYFILLRRAQKVLASRSRDQTKNQLTYQLQES